MNKYDQEFKDEVVAIGDRSLTEIALDWGAKL